MMDIIIAHNNLDCDGLAALWAMHRLRPAATPVLLGSLNRNVRDLVARYEGELRFSRLRDLPRRAIERIILVDTQTLPADEGFLTRIARSNPAIEIFDHHPLDENRPPSARITRADTGATTTILVEEMQERQLTLSAAEATLLLLGIYEDTGHLTYTTTTPRDVRAAAWLLEQGADLRIVAAYIDRPLSERQWQVYQLLLANVSVEQVSGYTVLLAAARAQEYVEELSTLAHKLTDQYDPDASFILVQMEDVVQIIARSRSESIDVSFLLKPLGGGGHAAAAAALVRGRELEDVQAELRGIVRQGLAPVVSAADIMTRELHSVAAGATIAAAYEALRRYGHEALPILDDGRLVGLIMRRDADKAMQYGLDRRPVEAFATFDVPTITPRTSLIEIRDAMSENSIGQLPVLDGDRLVGIVTRTDVMRRWRGAAAAINLAERLQATLAPDVLKLLTIAGDVASEMGFSLFLVGGFVRDLLLGLPNFDLDLVVEGDAIALANHLATAYGGRTRSHARFGTATWTVTPRAMPLTGRRPLALDFVTARTEFYERPAALPRVEAGSLRHDLYRRDFTINTMAICLNGARYGELIDFYGGKADLDRRLIRVLHNLSFIDDATRILRAARLAERLNFDIEARTAALIDDARASLERVSGQRIQHELKLLFEEAQPERIIKRLDDLDVLSHIHQGLRYTPWLADRFAALRHALPTWQSWGLTLSSIRPAPLFAAYLAILSYPLSRPEVAQLMARLSLAGQVGRLLHQVWDLRQQTERLASSARPSDIYRLLQPYLLEAIAIVHLCEDAAPVRQAIALYIEKLRHVRTDVTGSTLQSMGVRPGPIYGRILDALLVARLDGDVANRQEEEQLLRKLLARQSD